MRQLADRFYIFRTGEWHHHVPILAALRRRTRPSRGTRGRQIPDSGVGEVVLVIDDDPIVRRLIPEVLQEGGYAAIEAEDGPSEL